VNGALPEYLALQTGESIELRYGENPHQKARAAPVLGPDGKPIDGALDWSRKAGKPLSYNNLKEMIECCEAGIGFEDRRTVLLLKHGRPCSGAWTKEEKGMSEVYKLARAPKHKADFGNVMRVIGVVDSDFAKAVVEDEETKIFTEVMLADDYTEEALEILSEAYAEDKKMRIYQITKPSSMSFEGFIKQGVIVWQDRPKFRKLDEKEISKPVPKDLLREYFDLKKRKAKKMKIVGVVTEEYPDQETIKGLIAADEFVEKVSSNGIVLVGCEYGKNEKGDSEVKSCWIEGAATEESRVEAVIMAGIRAGERAKGSLLASDGSFPFPDNIEEAAKLGVKAIIQPGGSRKDKEIIELCNEYKIPMIFSGVRRFKH